MLICLLTALIARSSHRSLQREDAFFLLFFSRGKEESREEKKKGTEGEGHLHIICKLSLTHIAWQTHKKIATLHVLQGGDSPREKKKKHVINFSFQLCRAQPVNHLQESRQKPGGG